MSGNVVCPECYGPYLSTEVMATAKINSDFNWEIEPINPTELEEAISNPNTAVECDRCGWSGGYGDLVVIKNSGLEGIQYDSGHSPGSSVFSDVTPLPNATGKPEPIFTTGTKFLLNTTGKLNGEEEYIIINQINVIVNRATMTDTGMVKTNKYSWLYTFTPTDQNMYPSGKFITASKDQLRNAYMANQLTILE